MWCRTLIRVLISNSSKFNKMMMRVEEEKIYWKISWNILVLLDWTTNFDYDGFSHITSLTRSNQEKSCHGSLSFPLLISGSEAWGEKRVVPLLRAFLVLKGRRRGKKGSKKEDKAVSRFYGLRWDGFKDQGEEQKRPSSHHEDHQEDSTRLDFPYL